MLKLRWPPVVAISPVLDSPAKSVVDVVEEAWVKHVAPDWQEIETGMCLAITTTLNSELFVIVPLIWLETETPACSVRAPLTENPALS